jgi:hypothetical protein
MKTAILAYVIAFGGVAMIVVGLWGLYVLMGKGRRTSPEGLHTGDPNHSCRFCPDWPCAGLAGVAPDFCREL